MLVHGLGGRWQHYEPASLELAEHVRVLAVDLPGFGLSALPGQPMSLDEHVDAVADVCRDAGVEQLILAGHSMGGPLAMRFAQRHPGWASALVLVCGTVQTFQQTLAGRIRPWLRAPRTATATVAELALTSVTVPRALHGLLARNLTLRRLILWPFVDQSSALPTPYAAALIGGSGARGSLPTARALARITGWERPEYDLPPTYAINGARDRIAPLSDLRRFPVPFERATVLPAGHMVMLESRQGFARELIRITRDTWA
ncbi:MAG TPA: alpha/beta hydrolase [Solirubrobacteraceae bacterium]|nr:alpha/beta hydrolase [Solirubrobacteraceae bacterium]